MPKSPRQPVAPPEGSVWIKEAAVRLGVAVRTLYSWRYSGIGPESYVIGRKVAYEIAVLDAFLADARNQQREPSHD
ncbi:helix-turn-helix transcriptional regulator, partial [Streptomyces sp. NPDC058296]|uniref:helix-turn-helix transcriptional regulator n=1 Tax=Streptomyces sp. NPDC058296 TaxID=3346432 RepID=UPI0036EE2D48